MGRNKRYEVSVTFMKIHNDGYVGNGETVFLGSTYAGSRKKAIENILERTGYAKMIGKMYDINSKERVAMVFDATVWTPPDQKEAAP